MIIKYKTSPGFLVIAAVAILLDVPCTSRAQNIYVSAGGETTAYDAATGESLSGFTPISASVCNVAGLAVSGNVLYAVNNATTGQFDEFDATTGALINAFSTFSDPSAIAISGNDVYVADLTTVAEYDATTGAVISGFISPSGLDGVVSAVASGNDLYLSTGDSVNEYDGTTGALIAGFSTITAVSPHGLAISGTALYVSNTGNSTITEYDAITGAQVTGYSSPGGLNDNWGIAASDSTLYVANFGPGSSGTLNAYDMATGSAVAGFTPSIAGETDFVAYGSVPEPGTWGMAVAGIGLLGYVRHFRRTRQP